MPAAHIHGVTGPLTADPYARDREVPENLPEISARFRAPGLLLIGAISAGVAFLGAAVCTTMEYFKPKYRWNMELGIKYASGNGYWPETVSESVSDANSAPGKIFYTFSLLAGLALLISYYPYNLRNCYTGPAKIFHLVYWSTFRQFIPVYGLFMLIGVSVYPSAVAQETNGGMLCLGIHLLGASLMFMGYMLCEFKCMEMFGFTLPHTVSQKYLDIVGWQRRIRQVCSALMFAFYCLFLIFEGLIMIQNPCCADEWLSAGEWYNRTAPNGQIVQMVLERATVLNTAKDWYLVYKFCAYWSECLAGVCLIYSHITIWYYCEERHLKYGKAALDMLYDRDVDDDGIVDDHKCFSDSDEYEEDLEDY